jgi:hypothetical protein
MQLQTPVRKQSIRYKSNHTHPKSSPLANTHHSLSSPPFRSTSKIPVASCSRPHRHRQAPLNPSLSQRHTFSSPLATPTQKASAYGFSPSVPPLAKRSTTAPRHSSTLRISALPATPTARGRSDGRLASQTPIRSPLNVAKSDPSRDPPISPHHDQSYPSAYKLFTPDKPTRARITSIPLGTRVYKDGMWWDIGSVPPGTPTRLGLGPPMRLSKDQAGSPGHVGVLASPRWE